jgi:DNA-binding NarL/FixJ family response regulator
MKHVLLASDSASLRDEVKAVLSTKEFTVREVVAGEAVLPAVYEQVPDLVICDLQMGSQGGVAVTIDLRLEESADRLPRLTVLLLVDRRPDVFLARRSQADGYLVKPLDPIRLRRAITALLAGEPFEDPSYRPAESAYIAATAL